MSRASPAPAPGRRFGLFGAWIRELASVARWLVLCVVTGALVGLVAIGFARGVAWFGGIWHTGLPQSLPPATSLAWQPAIGLALLAAALVAGELLVRIEGLRPHGPAHLVVAAVSGQAPDLRAGFLSSVLAFVSVSGGASVGIFGPLVHLGACLSALVHRLWHRVGRAAPADLAMHTVLGAGAAAAIAAVFSAPIGAVIFGHELISRRFDRTGTGAMLASAFTAWWVSHRLFDLQPLFVPDHLPRLAGVHLSAALLLGLACGLVASAFIALARHAPRLALASRLPRRWQPLVPAALLFAMSPVLPHLLGPGLDAVAMAIDGRLTITLIVLLLAAKLVVTPVCLGFGLHGGTFAPALLLGALTAGLVSQLMPEAGGAGLALVGAAGCVAAVIGAPIATVVIVFELTGSYPWAVMSMVTVVAGAQIARVLAGPSLFDPPGR